MQFKADAQDDRAGLLLDRCKGTKDAGLLFAKQLDGSSHLLRDALAIYLKGTGYDVEESHLPWSGHEDDAAFGGCSFDGLAIGSAKAHTPATIDSRYILQVWNPLNSATALFERAVERDTLVQDTKESWERFALEHVALFKVLAQSWIRDLEQRPCIVVDRDALVQSPFATLHDVIVALDPAVAPDRVQVLNASATFSASRHKSIFHFRFFDLKFSAGLEQSVESEMKRLGLPFLVLSGPGVFDSAPDERNARPMGLASSVRKARQTRSGGTNEPALPRARGLVRVSCASLPRSGHHMLQQFLRAYFGARHSYCQFYDGPLKRGDCCNTYPCVNTDVNFQKSHDFGLSIRQDPDRAYAVQYRHPIKACVSAFEEALAYTRNFEDSAEQWRTFAWTEIKFFRAFIRRWVLDATLPHALLLDFDLVVRQPLHSLGAVVSLFEPEIEPDAERIIACVRQVEIGEVRDVQLFRHFDLEFFTQLERYCEAEMRQLGVPALFPVFTSDASTSGSQPFDRKTGGLSRLWRALQTRLGSG